MAALTIIQPGPQASVQGGPRVGHRHLGVPWAGAADALSLALANRLLGNALDAPGIEATFGGLTVRADVDLSVAVTGAPAPITVEGAPVPPHEVICLTAGQMLTIGPARAGARCTLGVAGGLAVPFVLGSPSTYAPARLAGHEGRLLREGDAVPLARPALVPHRATPDRFRPRCGGGAVLRAILGPEAGWLEPEARAALTATAFTVAARSDRMGLRLEGERLALRSDAALPSAAVLPGTVQLPPGGAPILLGPDAQTTGGYPRVASVIAADLHLIGQLRPGDTVRFYPRTPDGATRDTRAKAALWRAWLGDVWAM